jgi:hypothetical protein
MRFQVLTVTSMKIRAFWDTGPCSIVEVDRRFRGVYCLHHSDGGDSKPRPYIPEDYNVQKWYIMYSTPVSTNTYYTNRK